VRADHCRDAPPRLSFRTHELPEEALEGVALVGPDKKPVRVGFREVEVERDGRTKVMRERIGRRAGKEIEL